jgi:hypothetical protein
MSGDSENKGKPPESFLIYRLEGESSEAARARAALQPSTNAASALDKWAEALGPQDINEVRKELQQRAREVSSNDLTRLEAMLTAQAHTLDALFSNMTVRAHNTLKYPKAFELFMRLGLKAQAQCRATVETLAEMKNPKPVAFVQQANIATGPQQVNNGASPTPRAASRTGAGNAKSTNELLEGETNGNRLEHSSSGATGIGDTALATVGKVLGAEVGERQIPISRK